MVKKIGKICFYCIFTIVCLITITGCSLMNNEGKTIEDKTNEEITYLEDEILTIINKYAKGEYDIKPTNNDETNSDQSNEEVTLNWEEITKTVNKINETLDTIILDLSEIEISNDDLINFRNQINNLSISVTNQDKATFLQETAILYSLLPTFLEKYSNNNEISIMQLKSLAVTSFIYSDLLDWENAKNTIASAETKYKEMMDDVNYMREYSYNLNKVYVLLEEFKTVIDAEQNSLSKIKYINFIEKF